MEENDVLTLIAMETAEPKRKLNRSAGAVYVILIALMIGTISLANLLYARWQIPRYAVQPPIYALIALCGVIIYRRRTVSYRYTLTDRMFAVEHLAINREHTLMAVSLDEIRDISVYDRVLHRANMKKASILPKRKSTVILACENGRETACSISPSETFLQRLIEAVETAQIKEGTTD